MKIYQAIILGLVQGLTEFFPVSSSGHLVLLQELFHLNGSFLTFDTFLHLATVTVVIIFFWPKLKKIGRTEIIHIISGTIPIVIVGFLFKNQINALFEKSQLVAVTLIITGLINLSADQLLFRKKNNRKLTEISRRDSMIIGLYQAFAVIPGISRSGSTFLGAIQARLSREEAFNFVFYLAIPAILGATVLQIFELQQTGFTIDNPMAFLAGGLAAFISGFVSLTVLKKIIKQARLELFAYYCIALGAISLFLL